MGVGYVGILDLIAYRSVLAGEVKASAKPSAAGLGLESP